MIKLVRELLDHVATLPIVPSWEEGDPIPEDPKGLFKFVGAGSERVVWLGPDGMLYKAQKHSDWQSNWTEFTFSKRLRSKETLPLWVYIPETNFDETTQVLVTEYIQGWQPWECYYDACTCRGECRWERAAEAFDFCNSSDAHAGNCVIVECDSPDSFMVAIIDFTR